MQPPSELSGVVELLVAFVLSVPIGWDRERNNRSMGIRTFPLIAVASCAFIVVARQMSPDHPGEWNRTLEGVATGVGFLGAGAIVKHGVEVLGTTTAAGVWLTAALGAAAGFELWGIAVALSVIGFATLRLGVATRRIEPEPEPEDEPGPPPTAGGGTPSGGGRR